MYDALMKVSSGYKLIYYGLLIIVLAVVLMFVGFCFLGAMAAGQGGGGNAGAPNRAALGGAGLLAVGAVGMILLGTLLGLVGRFMCLATPPQADSARTLIMVSVAVEMCNLLASAASIIDDLSGNQLLPFQVRLALLPATMFAGILAVILFLLFTRSLAQFIRRRELAQKAMSVLWLWALVVVLYIAGIVVVIAGVGLGGLAGGRGGAAAGGGAAGGAAAGGCVGGLLMLVAGIVALVGLVQYAQLLTGMSAALQVAARRSRSGAYDDEDEYDDGYEEYDDDEDDRRRRRRRRDEDDEDEDDRPRGRGRDRDRDRDDDDDRRGRGRDRDRDDDFDDRDRGGKPWERR